MAHDIHLTDPELLAAFERHTLAHDAWTHRAHVRIAFLYASQLPFASALDQMRNSIKAYNASRNIAESLESGYHETITVAFMRLVSDALTRYGPFADSNSFCDRCPELLDKKILLRFYSRERIMTMDAKRTYVEPDLSELPVISKAFH